MAKENIELVDRPYGYIRVPLSRKIKFKKISFKNISSHWNEFRLKQLRNKLTNQREKLTEMEFSSEQLGSSKGRERVEMKIMRKTRALAKLESKITFLETGSYFGEDYIDSRAIKLKTLMIKNLEWNRSNLYGINDKAAQIILSGEQLHEKARTETSESELVPPQIEFIKNESTPLPATESVDKVIDEESAKIGARVREILAEKRNKEMNSSQQEENNNRIEENVAEETSTVVAKEEINGTIAEEMKKIDVTPIISSDKVAEAIEREMSKIKVSGNESTPAKVNKFINEDGTYRMKKEDIDEDFRITRFDRNELPQAETDNLNTENELVISPFDAATKRRVPDVETPRKAITALSDVKKLQFPELTPPSIKIKPSEQKTEEREEKREMPIVVPARTSPEKNTEKQNEAPVPPEISRDLGALMARVSVLKSEKKTIDSKAEDAEKKAQDAEQSYIETVRRLAEYADSLEKDCNESYQAMDNANKRAAATEAQIDAMLSMMENSSSEEQETVKGRTK